VTVRSRTVTTVAALTLTLALAACGADEKPQASESSTTPSTTTAAPTTPATTPSATTSAPAKGAHLTSATFLPAMKSAMAGKKSLRSTMKMTANGQTSTMTGVQTMGNPPALSVLMEGPAFGGRGRIMVVDGIIYLSMKGQTPAGKYLKVDPKDSKDPMARQMSGLLQNLDPTKTFDAFDSGLSNVKFAGTETIDGTKADRYKVTVDMAKALRAQGQPMAAGIPKTVTYDIWMDKANLIRRVSFALMGTRMEMNTKDWGKPVTIEAPPASAIVKG